jgi:serine-type D-Ala-D-Ala carboxypeptidase/endopeptidase (penicillin-binding protein 4)
VRRPHYKIKSLFSVLLFATLITSCQTTQPVPETGVNKKIILAPLLERIEAIIDRHNPHGRLGIQIVHLQKNEIIYQHNPQQMFTPGSILKLYTAAAALHYLGPSYRFATQVLVEDLDKNQIGNLYVRASGDPSFSASDIVKIANTVKQLGIKNIQGDIVIDDGQFDDVLWGNGWMWNDMIKGYSAPINALNVDYNRIAVFAWPQKKVGDPVAVTIEPYTNFINVKVTAKTAEENAQRTVLFSLSPPGEKEKKGTSPSHGLIENQTIYVSGQLPKHKTYQYETFSIANPSLFAGFLLKEQLWKNDIQVKGVVRQEKTAENARLIDTISSRPLSETLIDIVKYSNNQASETLLKAIGLKQEEAPGTFEKGTKAIRKFLNEKAKIKTKGLVNADASGLSRYSQTSPEQMTSLLRHMWRDFRSGSEFVATFPISGEDGTLNNSWKNSPLRQRIRAKTGSMSNICSLTGYLDGAPLETYAFTFMMNGSSFTGEQCRKLYEQILLEVLAS